MYKPIDPEFLSAEQDEPPISVNSTEDREKFLDDLLKSNLNESKQREKDSLREKIKFKKHPLEDATKQLRKEEKKKRDALALASASQQPKLNLSRKQRKKLKLYKLDKSEPLNYEEYAEINKLWKSYANSCLMSCLTPSNQLSEESVLNCMKQLDYHGCHLSVTRSSSKHLIGASGIVLQERKNVFYILTKENKISVIPKVNNLFEIDLLNCSKMTLVGSNMLYRPEMRTTKHAKIKTRTNIN